MSNDQVATIQFGGDATGAVGAAREAATAVRASVEGMHASFNSLKSQFGMVTAGFAAITAAVAGGSALSSFVNEAIAVTTGAVSMGKSLGISATAASVFEQALDDVGVKSELVAMAGKRVTMALSQGGEKFKALGVETRMANGEFRNSRDIMLDVNDKLRGFKEGTDRNIESMKIYGRSYADLAPFINKMTVELSAEEKAASGMTAERLRGLSASERYAIAEVEIRAKAMALNLVVGQESVDAAKKYAASKRDLKDVMQGVSRTIGDALIPRLTAMADFFISNGPAAVTVMRGVMVTYLTIQDAIADSAVALWGAIKGAFKSIGTTIDAVFGTSSAGMTGMQFFANVMTVIRAGVIIMATGLSVGFELVGSAVSQLVDWVVTLGEVYQRVVVDRDWNAGMAAWDAGFKRREQSVAESAKRVLGIAEKGAADLGAALMADPTAAAKVTETKDPKDNKGGSAHIKAVDNGEFAVAKARAANELSLKKEVLSESLKIAQSMHEKELLSDREFYDSKVANEQSGLDAEAQAKRIELAHTLVEQKKVQAGEDAKANGLKAKQIALEGELAVIQLKRLDAAVVGERDFAKASEARTKKIEEEKISFNRKIVDLDIAGREEELRVAKAYGAITEAEEIAQQRRLIVAKYDNERVGILARRALVLYDSAERQKINNELAVLDKKHSADMVKNANDAAVAMFKPFQSMQQSMQNSFQSGLDSLFDRSKTFAAKMKALWSGLATMFVQEMVTKPLAADAAKEAKEAKEATLLLRKVMGGNARMLVDKAEALAGIGNSTAKGAAGVAAEGAHTAAAVVGAETRIAVGWVAAVQNAAASAWATVISVMNSAWAAMAAAYAAIAAIPVVGPVLAPVVAGVTFAAVAGIAGHVMSAKGGYDVPAGVNPLTQLHEREMVLPQKQADAVRKMADGGGGGGDGDGRGGALHVTIAGQQLAGGFFMAHQSELVAALKMAHRNGRGH